METSKVFISHAGADSERALEVARLLEEAGLCAVVDRRLNKPGDDFLNFMERALTECDYCLLLWSAAASQRAWVRVEWEAALYRAVQESRRFLIVGRLEPHPPPALLAPRLSIDLFPQLRPGIDELINLWREDSLASGESGRPVGRAAVNIDDGEGETVYVTSDLFGLTIPVRLTLGVPSGVHLDKIISAARLPRQFDYDGRVGVRMEYRFTHGGKRLARDKSLAAQGVERGSVLWLEVEMTPFHAVPPVEGGLGSAVFRGGGSGKGELAFAVRRAHESLLAAMALAGLR